MAYENPWNNVKPWEKRDFGNATKSISGLDPNNYKSKDQRVYNVNRNNDKQYLTRSYWDAYNKNQAGIYNKNAQNFIQSAKDTQSKISDVWTNKSKNASDYEAMIKDANAQTFNYDPKLKTDFTNAKSISGSFSDAYSDFNKEFGWLNFDHSDKNQSYRNRLQFMNEYYGFNGDQYVNSQFDSLKKAYETGEFSADTFDPYENFKTGFIDSYYDKYASDGWDFINSDVSSQNYIKYLELFGAQNEQDAEIMATLGINGEFGDIEGFKLDASNYNLDKSWESDYEKIKQSNNTYFTEKEKAEKERAYINENLDDVDADTLFARLNNIDSNYFDFAGGKEDYFSSFYNPYNQYNAFADTMRGNADSLEEQLGQLGIRDIDALREGRTTIDDYMAQINNYESDLTGLNRNELINEFNDLLYQNTEDGRGGFQGLIDEWGIEDSKIQSARNKLGSRDEQLAEMLSKLGIYNKDSLDLFQDNFDQLDKYRSDYEGEDKFTSKLDFDFSNEFSDIDSVMADYMGKYDQRQSELDSLFMKDGTSFEDLLSGTAENDLDGFTELNKLLNQNKNELGKFTGDDLADETSLFESLFGSTNEATKNIYDQRDNVESTLSDLLERIRNDDFYSDDDLTEYRDLLTDNKDLIDYWGADGAKEEAGLLGDEITDEANRLIQEDKNVANYRQSQKEMILEMMRKSGGKLQFNDLPFNDLSDAEIARLFMGTRENFDDPDKLSSIFSQIGGG